MLEFDQKIDVPVQQPKGLAWSNYTPVYWRDNGGRRSGVERRNMLNRRLAIDIENNKAWALNDRRKRIDRRKKPMRKLTPALERRKIFIAVQTQSLASRKPARGRVN
ncbi:MAG: hypothetical protein QNI92_06155 [Desulfobacterales bacterium]|nr:hypothetical protein [Desulfobacterales bacterium]MDJ0913746.1 hypothetical protein [Desulfobacterales bacterium]